MRLTVLSLSLLLFLQSTFCVFKLKEVFQWDFLDYSYPTHSARVQAYLESKYIPENNLPVGIERWKDKLFVTVPRWRAGIPATLNYVPLNKIYTKSPVLIPYPNWQSNEMGNCENGLTTVYRIKADACDRLWVLDVGTLGIANTTKNVCPYTLNVFDLSTDTRIRSYQFKTDDINEDTFIANIVVELGSTCDDAHAYFSDELGYGLIVYSWKENRSWRFTHSFFRPDPLAGDFTIDNLNFQWDDEGIFGMSLSPILINGDRFLFFSPLASFRGFAVLTSILKNSSKVEDSYHDFIALHQRGPFTHTTAQVMDDNGIQLFNLIDRNAVGCWNSANPYRSEYMGIVDHDDEKLIFPSDVKIDREGNVWVMSDQMSNFLLADLDYTRINFRVFYAPLKILIKDTICDPGMMRDKENVYFSRIN